MLNTSYSQLSAEHKELIDAAEKALEFSYNPYNSQMKVAAAARSVSGKIIVGASYVNSCSPSSICAERSVIITANSQGERNLLSMAVIGKKDSGVKEPVMPCGNCRQVMQELVNITGHDLEIICSNGDKTKVVITSLTELMPFPYNPV